MHTHPLVLSPDKRKSAGVQPRPGGVDVHPDVQMEASALNGLLVDAMNGSLATAESFTSKLIEQRLFFYFSNCSPSLDGMNYVDPARQPIQKVFEQELDRFLQEAIRPWLLVYANDPAALRAGELTKAFRKADNLLAISAGTWSWPDILTWQGRVKKQQDGTYALVPNTTIPLFTSLTDPPPDDAVVADKLKVPLILADLPPEERASVLRQSYEKTQRKFAGIAILRERVRWLWILCDGLRRIPVRIASGAHEPRKVIRHIAHPAQTQQDALNEFAASLVNPPQRFVAHVRLSTGYHQVKLVPPVQSPENMAQLQQIRLRSQQRYQRPEDTREGPATPGMPPDSQSPPAISRRPGGWQEPPDDDIPEDDENTA